MKKRLLSLAALVAPAFVFAEGTTPSVSTTNAEAAITQAQTAFETILGSLGAAVLAVVLAGVAIWAIPKVVGSLKSAFSSGKGR